jgi:TonB-linked SusC/RagA family outer membrane protein
MLLHPNCKVNSLWPRSVVPNLKALRAMKVTCVLLLAISLQISAKSYSQGITLSVKNAPLETLLKAVEQQSNFRFVYSKEAMERAKPVTIDVKNESIDRVLKICFAGQPISYSIEERFIIIKVADHKGDAADLFHDVKGKVENDRGEPIAGVTVRVRGTGKLVMTDANGEFVIVNIQSSDVLLVSGAEIEPIEVRVNAKDFVRITITQQIKELDRAVVIGYGTTTKRYTTGSIGKINSEEIMQQPVANPLAALEGRIAGLVITQSSGIPGSSFKVQVRGQSSIGTTPGSLPQNNPLFIIDGVPFAAGNEFLGQLISAAGNPDANSNTAAGLSPFNSINPADIESIEILKDADATAIYGSRGANGVVLITTRKGKEGKTKVTSSFYQGWSKVTRLTDFLNTQQYIEMRREAFKNDNITPTINLAPDLLLWDTTRYTNFKKTLIGGTAKTTNADVSLSGGSATTQFLIGAGYRRETTVFPGDMADTRGSVHLNLSHSSTDKKFSINLSTIYSTDKNNLIAEDLTKYLSLPPNYPSFFDSSGKLNWIHKGTALTTNPFAYLLNEYSANTDNLLANAQLNYTLFTGMTARVSLGYNTITVEEKSLNPKAAQNPAINPQGFSQSGYRSRKNIIAEPMLEYKRNIADGKLNVLVGGTWQQLATNRTATSASGFTSDALLQTISAASSVTTNNSYSQYRYAALFGRINYVWRNKYIANLSGRRDGSSRFGNGKQFADFGALGAGWIFSNESFSKKIFPFLSYGKLRSSYGTTGNDQIGDYQYIDGWSATPRLYQGTGGLYPVRLYNPDYAWEINYKLEAAIELGLLKDKVIFSAAYFRNRSSNQLIAYSLPTQTGFVNIAAKNFPAVVQNKGWEFTLEAQLIATPTFKWKGTVNLTIPKNTLIDFPGLETSSYNYLRVGQPLSITGGYHLTGVNPSTGVYTFNDIDKDGQITFQNDFLPNIGNRDPKFYGGVFNSIQYKNLQLTLFVEFKKQYGSNFWLSQATSNYLPGFMYNQPNIVVDRWRKNADVSPVQILTTSTGSAAYAAWLKFANSSGVLSDASYIRLKNLSLSYSLPAQWLKRIRAEQTRLYVQAQNLLTITKYKGSDPEVQSLYRLPPLQVISAGFSITF